MHHSIFAQSCSNNANSENSVSGGSNVSRVKRAAIPISDGILFIENDKTSFPSKCLNISSDLVIKQHIQSIRLRFNASNAPSAYTVRNEIRKKPYNEKTYQENICVENKVHKTFGSMQIKTEKTHRSMMFLPKPS